MKFFRYLQKIENKFHPFWINRCLDPWDDLLKKYWNWVGSMPALSKTNKDIFDYFLAFLNILLFIITCLCLPLYWFFMCISPIYNLDTNIGFNGNAMGYCIRFRYPIRSLFR